MATVGAPIEANDGSLARILGKHPVLWVGAGLSIAAGYPTTGAVLDALVAAADDPIDTARSFYEVVDAVVASVRAGRVRDVLQRLFQPARPPTPVHRLAKAGAFAAIVTTNYDDLMERALAAEVAPFVLQPLEGNDTVTGDGVRLLKIHGSHDDWAKVVLSGRSYDEYGARNPFLCKQLDVLLRQQPILFVGCSLQDPRILDWLAGLSPVELEGLKEWRPVLTSAGWKTALAHSHGGADAKVLRERFDSHDWMPYFKGCAHDECWNHNGKFVKVVEGGGGIEAGVVVSTRLLRQSRLPRRTLRAQSESCRSGLATLQLEGYQFVRQEIGLREQLGNRLQFIDATLHRTDVAFCGLPLCAAQPRSKTQLQRRSKLPGVRCFGCFRPSLDPSVKNGSTPLASYYRADRRETSLSLSNAASIGAPC